MTVARQRRRRGDLQRPEQRKSRNGWFAKVRLGACTMIARPRTTRPAIFSAPVFGIGEDRRAFDNARLFYLASEYWSTHIFLYITVAMREKQAARAKRNA